MNSLAEQARPSANTGKTSRIDKITAALTQMAQGGDIPDCVAQTPGEFLREFYEAWLENGGLVGGKNRNSVRKMRNWLTGDAEVRSLHPKLTGRVRISKEDAGALIGLFLSRWRYVGVRRGDKARKDDGYASFPCQDVDKLRELVIDAMFPRSPGGAQRGLLLPPRRAGRGSIKEARNAWDAIADLLQESDAVLTLSRHRTVIGATPAETMENFWHLLDHWEKIIGNRNAILIWIVDIGSRQIEDHEAWPDFYNFEFLKSQFRALATFDSIIEDEGNQKKEQEKTQTQIHDAFLRLLEIPEEGHREKRWRWLCEHAVVVVLNLRQEEFRDFYTHEDRDAHSLRLKDIGVTAEHILPSILPHRWGRQLRELYGENIEDVTDATLTVFFRMSGWNDLDEIDNGIRRSDVRYFAYALNSTEIRGRQAPWTNTLRSCELHSPGDLYDDAFRIVYWAARHRLKEWQGSREGHDRDWAIAIAYLRNLRFQVLRLPDFLRIHRLPGDL